MYDISINNFIISILVKLTICGRKLMKTKSCTLVTMQHFLYICVCLVCFNIIMFDMFKRAFVFYSKYSTNKQLRYNVARHPFCFHHKNIAFLCKSHYIDCLIKIMGIGNLLDNSSYTLTTIDTLGMVRVRCEF